MKTIQTREWNEWNSLSVKKSIKYKNNIHILINHPTSSTVCMSNQSINNLLFSRLSTSHQTHHRLKSLINCYDCTYSEDSSYCYPIDVCSIRTRAWMECWSGGRNWGNGSRWQINNIVSMYHQSKVKNLLCIDEDQGYCVLSWNISLNNPTSTLNQIKSIDLLMLSIKLFISLRTE